MPQPGRPKKKRPLTAILQAVGKEKTYDNLGNPVPREEMLSRMVWEFTTEGSVRFPNGRVLEASARDWKDAAQWIYNHSDGPARADLDVNLGTLSELEAASLDELRAIGAAVFGNLGGDSGDTIDADGQEEDDAN